MRMEEEEVLSASLWGCGDESSDLVA